MYSLDVQCTIFILELEIYKRWLSKQLKALKQTNSLSEYSYLFCLYHFTNHKLIIGLDFDKIQAIGQIIHING